MFKLNYIYLFIIALLFSTASFAQNALPTAFIMGDYENQYENLYGEHSDILLTVCENDMESAFEKWMNMLGEMEAYADQIGYDLKGIKIFLNVFWDKSGKIDHIMYYPKPVSRNTDFEELTAFFKSFISNYDFPIKSESNFYHSGQASFPTTYKIIHNAKKK
jgi:hypothetical protein